MSADASSASAANIIYVNWGKLPRDSIGGIWTWNLWFNILIRNGEDKKSWESFLLGTRRIPNNCRCASVFVIEHVLVIFWDYFSCENIITKGTSKELIWINILHEIPIKMFKRHCMKTYEYSQTKLCSNLG